MQANTRAFPRATAGRVWTIFRYREAIVHLFMSLFFLIQGPGAKGELRLFATARKVIQFAVGNNRLLSSLSHEHVITERLRPGAYCIRMDSRADGGPGADRSRGTMRS